MANSLRAAVRGAVGRGDPRGGLRPDEQRYRVAERLQRLNDLGFDVGEVELITSDEGARLRVQDAGGRAGAAPPRVLPAHRAGGAGEPGPPAAQRPRGFRAWLEQRDGGPVPETVAGSPLGGEVYQPVVDAIPVELAGRLAPAEVFHEILEHRWFLSERAGARRRDDGGRALVLRDRAAADAPELTSPSVMRAWPGRADAPPTARLGHDRVAPHVQRTFELTPM